jgi:hypothetical protein
MIRSAKNLCTLKMCQLNSNCHTFLVRQRRLSPGTCAALRSCAKDATKSLSATAVSRLNSGLIKRPRPLRFIGLVRACLKITSLGQASISKILGLKEYRSEGFSVPSLFGGTLSRVWKIGFGRSVGKVVKDVRNHLLLLQTGAVGLLFTCYDTDGYPYLRMPVSVFT